jgi:hypothetical protein
MVVDDLQDHDPADAAPVDAPRGVEWQRVVVRLKHEPILLPKMDGELTGAVPRK